ncbi:MAG: polysaccharide deacetylase family protein [candidate division Zixibacteria bacterium]|nr:polysaccharide deacetylase family protein [candidate division Zixibacteria bacterium]
MYIIVILFIAPFSTVIWYEGPPGVNLNNRLKRFLRYNDYLFYKAHSRVFEESNSLICLLFHTLFTDETESRLRSRYPQSKLQLDDLCFIIEFYLDHGFNFTSPDGIISGLDPEKNHVLLTFDDGYYCNSLTLPILKHYNVPATFFISADNVENGKAFWWDIIYRERVSQNVSEAEIYRECVAVKKMPPVQIDTYITETFGENAFQPQGDLDRPFTPQELKSFSSEPLVSLGNHCRNHTILTKMGRLEIMREIGSAQDFLAGINNEKPGIIAYPYGDFNDQVIQAACDCGLKLGMTVEPGKNHIPLDICSRSALSLKRYIPQVGMDMRIQCELFQSDYSLYNTIRGLYHHFCSDR